MALVWAGKGKLLQNNLAEWVYELAACSLVAAARTAALREQDELSFGRKRGLLVVFLSSQSQNSALLTGATLR